MPIRSHKLSLSQNGDAEPQHTPPTSSRTFSSTKRYESTSSHGGRSNPFKDMPPLSTTGISSPSIRQSGASSAFGLGSGAFGFSSATKTPKTPGTGFDFVTSSSGNVPALPTTVLRGGSTVSSAFGKIKSATQVSSGTEDSFHTAPLGDSFHTASLGDSISTASVESAWPLRHNWVIWYKPPTGKNTDYEKSIKAMCRMTTAPEFWKVFVHLKCPSQLPVISEYHFFKEGIRAMWEDDENIRGGKWTIRLKKGVADLYWEELMMGMIGNQFAEASDEVCGAVLSVRSGEDILSVWTKNDGGRNVKIRYVAQSHQI